MFLAIPKRLITQAIYARSMAGLHRNWWFSAIGPGRRSDARGAGGGRQEGGATTLAARRMI